MRKIVKAVKLPYGKAHIRMRECEGETFYDVMLFDMLGQCEDKEEFSNLADALDYLDFITAGLRADIGTD